MNKTMEQGVKEIMAILGEAVTDTVGNEQLAGAGGALDNSTKTKTGTKASTGAGTNTNQSTIAPVEATPKVIVYDGYGHIISVGGVKTHVGSKKRAKRVRTTNDIVKADLMDAVEVLLNKVKAFEGKVGRNVTDGIIIRMADADYCVKVTGHAKPEFTSRELDFKPEKSYLTRGKAINHAPAIAKILVAEFENEKWGASFGTDENQNSFTLLEAKAAGVRFEIQNPKTGAAEYSFKITKKRARVVMD